MALDVSFELINNLEIAYQRIDTLERALSDERTIATNLRADLAGTAAERDSLATQLCDMHKALESAQAQQSVTDAARPPALKNTPRIAGDWISILGRATTTDASTVRWNLTYSDAYGELRDNALAVDGLPLTQSIRLLCWLAEHVSDGYGHKHARYEMLLRRQMSLERLLD